MLWIELKPRLLIFTEYPLSLLRFLFCLILIPFEYIVFLYFRVYTNWRALLTVCQTSFILIMCPILVDPLHLIWLTLLGYVYIAMVSFHCLIILTHGKSSWTTGWGLISLITLSRNLWFGHQWEHEWAHRSVTCQSTMPIKTIP